VRRATLAAAALVLLAGGLPAAAKAHVEVTPDSATVREEVELTFRVPNERDVPFTAVRISFPKQVSVAGLAAPPPGWTMKVLKTADKRSRGVVYTGGSVGPGEYQDFTLLAAPLAAGQAVWPVQQTYGDGKVKPWTGPPEKPGAPDDDEGTESGPTAEGPAPALQIRAAAAAAAPAVTAAHHGGTSDDKSNAAIWLGVVAIALAFGSALLSGLLWSTRPLKLPEDDESEPSGGL